MCFSDRQPGDRGPRRVSASEIRDAFATGWRVDSVAPERFDVNHMSGPTHAEAWLADLIAT
jgi:hypothetical protein